VSDKLLMDKNPVISFRVVEDGTRPVDEADSNLVIDTSDGQVAVQTGCHSLRLILLFSVVINRLCWWKRLI